MSLTPGSASILLGNMQAFTATVSGTSDTAVSWTVNGVPGGNSTVGTISAAGLYTAPADLPSPATVAVRATSHADNTRYAAAQVTITSDIALSLAPGAASVELGAVQSFHATLASSGHPDTAVRWNLSGAACPAACGTVDASGNYTAPRILPASPSVTLTAQSAADSSKQASATLTLTSSFTLTITAPASDPAGATASLTATLQPVSGSNPDTVLSWALSGAGCAGSACGTLTSTGSASSTGGATIASATYTAPATPPNPASVVITVTPAADPARQVQAAVTITAVVSVGVSPASATRAINHRLTLSVAVGGTANTAVTWSVNGVAGGNASVGQLCVAGSNPCQAVTTSSSAQVDYLAPGALPTPNPVTVQAVSQADPTKSAAAQITIIAHILVTVSPASVTLAPAAIQQFFASVLGTDNQNVVWQVQGAACGGAAAPCGTINANGVYTAPASAPAPNTLQVVAVSSENTAQTGTANVTLTTGPAILGLLPASVYAGGTAGFTLKVEGSGFAASSPGPSSTLLLGGTPRTTTCNSALECTAAVAPADVAAAGTLAVQIKNPDGTLSNSVSLVVLAAPGSAEVIALTAAAPQASGKDLVVVQPTTAGVSSPGASVDLNVAALGLFSTANNSCTLGGNPLTLLRPASGTAAVDICLFSESGLDTSMTYTVSGPGDVLVIAKQPAGLGIIHLTLQLASTALPGARTLFIQNTNLDETAASGALEVE
ncbi:MAG: hypothetical protein LAN84_10825 [Acidobacteriia bacterium]|nr:hypothetical protein [Terriglobia bacterium]